MSDVRNWMANIVTGAVTVCALALGGLRLKEAVMPAKSSAGFPPPTRLATWRTFASSGERIGPEAAAVTIVEFADFQCPFCRNAAADLRALRARYPKEVVVVYRHFPLDGHRFAIAAARAAECAATSSRFEAYHDSLFSQQSMIGKRTWLDFAREAGVSDTISFNRCIADTTRTMPIVERDLQAGNALHLEGTPTFLINDLQVSGYPGPEALQSYVMDALRRGNNK